MKYLDALAAWLSSKDGTAMNNTINRRGLSPSEISPSSLPDKYNSAKFDGAYVKNGKFARTVGEYKKMYE